ncbi:MAG: hypothetical protein ABIH59_00585 [archaeon]
MKFLVFIIGLAILIIGLFVLIGDIYTFPSGNRTPGLVLIVLGGLTTIWGFMSRRRPRIRY